MDNGHAVSLTTDIVYSNCVRIVSVFPFCLTAGILIIHEYYISTIFTNCNVPHSSLKNLVTLEYKSIYMATQKCFAVPGATISHNAYAIIALATVLLLTLHDNRLYCEGLSSHISFPLNRYTFEFQVHLIASLSWVSLHRQWQCYTISSK